MSQYIPKPGERVIVNGGLVATVESVNVEGDRVVYVSRPPGGGTNTHSEHLSQVHFESLEPELPLPKHGKSETPPPAA
jgi:hypothetical protein